MSIPKPRERVIQKACLDYLGLMGVFAWRQNSGAMTRMDAGTGKSRYTRFNHAPGCSDIIGLLPSGRFLAVEVKQPGGKPTAVQQSFLDQIRANGGLALIVTSVVDLQNQLYEAGELAS